MKTYLYLLLFLIIGGTLVAGGAYLGVWFERAHTIKWRQATFECVEDWLKCEEKLRAHFWEIPL